MDSELMGVLEGTGLRAYTVVVKRSNRGRCLTWALRFSRDLQSATDAAIVSVREEFGTDGVLVSVAEAV